MARGLSLVARRVIGAAAWTLVVHAADIAMAAPPKRAQATEPSLPSPKVKLSIAVPAGGAPWRARIENTGDVPIRIPADPRLLVLELTPAAPTGPTKKTAAPLRCTLPADARPSTDEGSELVIPPSRAWSTTFDPLFYCFGLRERTALVAGTTVVATFGWPTTPKATASSSPPLAVTPVGAAIGKVAAQKALVADPVTLTEAVPIANAEGDATEVKLAVPEALDAARGVELGTTITLTNDTDRAITLLYRPEMFLFTVTGPTGTVSCGNPRQVSSPIRELFITVGVKGKAQVGVLFSVTCPPDTFEDAGIYRVLPRLDTTGASGRAVNLTSWDGVARATTPLLVRVRNKKKPGLPPRPNLD